MNILALSGFVPEQICDTVRFTQYTGDRNISHYCGYASDFISQVIQDESVDGAVYPKSCDSTRNISSYLSESGKFRFQLNVPVYNACGAEEYFASSVRAYKNAVEEFYGISINDIDQRIEAVDRRNAVIRRKYEDIAECSYADYLENIHRMLKTPLFLQNPEEMTVNRAATEKRVYLAGSFLSNTEIARQIEDVGLTVVGDDFPESGRLASMEKAEPSADPYIRIASTILSMRLSPTQNHFRSIIEHDMKEIKHKAAKGVIYITQKYCEPYEYLYSIYKSEMEKLGLPVLHITLNDTEDNMKTRLALEAFADII